MCKVTNYPAKKADFSNYPAKKEAGRVVFTLDFTPFSPFLS